MKKYIIIALLSAATITKAQTTNNAITEHDPAVKAKDAQIKTDIIDPAEQAAPGQAPDWMALTKTITEKYDAVTADRTVTKAKIYFYFGKDWPTFCAAIVHFTQNWELADDYKLLNKNADMILQHSENPGELKEALRWAKAAADSDPANEKYKGTYEALRQKVNP